MVRLRAVSAVVLIFASIEVFGGAQPTPPDVVGPTFSMRLQAGTSYVGVAAANDTGVFGSAIGDLYVRSLQRILFSTNDGVGVALKIDATGLTSTGPVTAPAFIGNASSATNFTGSLGGDVTGTQSATVVGSVGGKSAVNVASAVQDVEAATETPTPSTLVKRDATGAINVANLTFSDGSVQSSAYASRTPKEIATLRWYDFNKTFPPITVDDGPIGIAFDGDNMWVVNNLGNSLTKINVASGATQGVPLGAGKKPFQAAFDGTFIWVTNTLANSVTRIRTSNLLSQSFPVGANPRGIAFDGESIWVANFDDSTVSKLDASTGALINSYAVGTYPLNIAFDGANVWVVNSGSANVTKLRASDGATLGTFDVGFNPRGVVYDGEFIWVSNYGSDSVTKLRASNGAVVDTYPMPAVSPEGLAFDGAYIWVVCYETTTIVKLRQGDGAVVAQYAPSGDPQARYIAFDGRNVWMPNFALDTVSRY